MKKKRNSTRKVRKIVAKALTESSGGILDAIPAYGPDGSPLNGKEVWRKVSAAPKKEEIDSSRSPVEMLLRGKAILKDGRRVTW